MRFVRPSLSKTPAIPAFGTKLTSEANHQRPLWTEGRTSQLMMGPADTKRATRSGESKPSGRWSLANARHLQDIRRAAIYGNERKSGGFRR